MYNPIRFSAQVCKEKWESKGVKRKAGKVGYYQLDIHKWNLQQGYFADAEQSKKREKNKSKFLCL